MCFGDSGSGAAKVQQRKADQTALEMKKAEKQRQRDILTGKGSIDSAFNTYGDDYYGGFKDSYTNYYLPQLEDQYTKAKGKMTAALAGRGMLESTVGAGAIGDLSKANDLERTNVANSGVDAANALRGTVEKAKTNLYALNEASADPQGINARAMGEATSLAAPTSFSPIGNVFASALEPWLQYANGRVTAPRNYSSPYSGGAPSGAGSQRVI